MQRICIRQCQADLGSCSGENLRVQVVMWHVEAARAIVQVTRLSWRMPTTPYNDHCHFLRGWRTIPESQQKAYELLVSTCNEFSDTAEIQLLVSTSNKFPDTTETHVGAPWYRHEFWCVSS